VLVLTAAAKVYDDITKNLYNGLVHRAAVVSLMI